MKDQTLKIRELASKLLAEGTVDVVIGFKEGSVPMATCPYIARTPKQAEELIWDNFCGMNLANYLTGRNAVTGNPGAAAKPERIGIIAKGCDTRNIVTHIIENKIQRDQLHIIGVPCQGMMDKTKVALKVDGKKILSAMGNGDDLTVTTGAGEILLKKTEVMKDNCLTCLHKNPVIYDDLATALVEEQTLEEPFADVCSIEEMDTDAKWSHFNDLVKNCIRCYACRNACPLCYCPTCFVDEAKPQWVGKGQNPTDVMTFHLLRAYHCAGRCTDCGACEQACPMDIKVREFTRKMNKDSFEIYGWEAGLTLDERPPLDTFKPEDPDDFIK